MPDNLMLVQAVRELVPPPERAKYYEVPMKQTRNQEVIQIPAGVWETAETKEELEDWLLAHNPRMIRRLRRIRRQEDLAGRGKTLEELARQWNIKL